jgi:hypothetical protein
LMEQKTNSWFENPVASKLEAASVQLNLSILIITLVLRREEII